MDQSLKQRLVGVVVITALAAIFVPMLFDDPVEDRDQTISELGIPPSPVASYEQDIEPAQTSVEEVLELPEPDYVLAESDLEEVNIQPEPAAKQQQPVPAQVKPPSKQTSSKPVNRQPPPALVRWVIQVGSFSEQKNADALKDKLIKQGFNAFVDTVETKQNKTLYRVKVGPELDKQRAEQTQAKLKKLNKIKSILKSE